MSARENLFRTVFKVLRNSGLGYAMAPVTQGCGAIFMLHRVLPSRPDAFQPNGHLEITPEFLRTAVNRIRDNGYEILALSEVADLLKSGYGRKRYAALTFDDGYRDNLEVAYPVLKELDAPFTVYTASGLIDRTTEIWWVALERIIAANDEIRLSNSGEGAGIAARTLDEKQVCFERLCKLLTQEVSEAEQRTIIRALADRYQLDLSELADELMMTWDEVRQLASDQLVTIGAHTHDHFAVARLSPEEAFEDIRHGVDRLEAETGHRPKHFAYPYGYSGAVDASSAEIARRFEFDSAVTTMPGVLKSVHAGNPLMLPRVSLNGRFQDDYVVDQYLTGAPFALYNAAKWAAGGFGLRPRTNG